MQSVSVFASVLGYFLLGIFTLRAGFGILAWRSAEKLEKPSYKVIGKQDGVELRSYSPYVIAEVVSNGNTMKKANSAGFRKIAGYIFGKNRERTGFFKKAGPCKMKMTAPVRTELAEKNTRKKYSLSFVMSDKYPLSKLPIPDDKSVKLRKIPAHFMAVKSFSGPPPDENTVAKFRADIMKVLNDNGISHSFLSNDKTFLYQYHDPFATPNFLRKNEVGVTLSKKGAAAVYMAQRAQQIQLQQQMQGNKESAKE
mmetsp:Transcript_30204/g.73513  ORF Transcript_30204/g.73513 Transcript_30204/m.73513 type:complete len:254 (+) Transcript_30204:121-882(+)|eukprot:CAMPEP_0114505792 /NCGR_PEP_ID=MMETSP0109-20121206/11051_1 /TAXON_ID=29199 /ORGANISM="Chlorarachnion reptans, Strain CCCM449" /LENGTH=253 /DNA_ID=CAMNT_0001684273 /DNA_START=124 /DNA_END=885 /DNA_ORIENTATION=-